MLEEHAFEDKARLQERYLQDSLMSRLDRLAANLTCIQSFSYDADNHTAVERLVEESKLFVEWTAGKVDIDNAAELVSMQVQLARWQRGWQTLCVDPVRRMEMATQVEGWSEWILELSGTLSGVRAAETS